MADWMGFFFFNNFSFDLMLALQFRFYRATAAAQKTPSPLTRTSTGTCVSGRCFFFYYLILEIFMTPPPRLVLFTAGSLLLAHPMTFALIFSNPTSPVAFISNLFLDFNWIQFELIVSSAMRSKTNQRCGLFSALFNAIYWQRSALRPLRTQRLAAAAVRLK